MTEKNKSGSQKTFRQSEKRRIRNKAQRSRMRTQIRKFLEAVEAGDKDAAQAEYVKAVSFLDRASKHHIIHDNQASRRKSRLKVRLNALVEA